MKKSVSTGVSGCTAHTPKRTAPDEKRLDSRDCFASTLEQNAESGVVLTHFKMSKASYLCFKTDCNKRFFLWHDMQNGRIGIWTLRILKERDG